VAAAPFMPEWWRQRDAGRPDAEERPAAGAGKKGGGRLEVEGGADRWAPPVGDRVRERGRGALVGRLSWAAGDRVGRKRELGRWRKKKRQEEEVGRRGRLGRETGVGRGERMGSEIG
jgi:hypothetical protein